MIRNCEFCSAAFEADRFHPKQRFCHKNCNEKARRRRFTPLQKAHYNRLSTKWKKSERGRRYYAEYAKRDDVVARQKAAHKRYRSSPRGIELRKEYDKSPGRKAYKSKYNKSENAKQLQAVSRGRYRIKEGVYMANERARQYGLTVEQLKAFLDAGCYAPGCKWSGRLHIDHDHGCCNKQGSCGKCVRGALCPRHNLYLGMLETDPFFASWVINQKNLKNQMRREA